MSRYPRRLREVSSYYGDDHAGKVHLAPSAAGFYDTLCGVAGEETELEECSNAPTCPHCLDLVHTVLGLASVRTLREWAAIEAAKGEV